MARAVVSIRSREASGNDLIVEMYVTFFGADMAKPDSSLVKMTASPTDTPANWRSRRNAAIQTEADRLGVTWNGKIISDGDLLRDA